MKSIDVNSMKAYLSQSLCTINIDKINGLLVKIDLRNHLKDMGLGQRISQEGWIIGNLELGMFENYTSLLFPMAILPEIDYSSEREFEEPPRRLHTICSTMHQIGIQSYYCVPVINENNNPHSINWYSTQLGIPSDDEYHELIANINNFSERERRYNFLRYHTDSTIIPLENISEEFTKENLRVSIQNKFMTEMSDIDGVFWGEQYTYPIEIKEKTSAFDKKIGDYFGIDVGPFVKLAYYAAKKGSLHSLFIVKEINNTEDRNLVNWWYITYDTLAQYASWVSRGGGRNMQGGNSTVIMIPKSEFKILNVHNLKTL